MKPEPWWPLKWGPWTSPSGIEIATLKGHPTIEQIERTKNIPLRVVRFRYRAHKRRIRGDVTEWYAGVDEITLRSMLLELAYPEGNDDTET